MTPAERSRQSYFANKAKRNRTDEYFTSIKIIEEELMYYTHNFRGQVVCCNCDDYMTSAYYQFFKENFKSLGLRGLIASTIRLEHPPLLPDDQEERPTHVKFDGVNEYTGHLERGGGYECATAQRLLKMSDIVVTTPPFSLFGIYFKNLIDNRKRFLILANIAGAFFRSVFPYVKSGCCKRGFNYGKMKFRKSNGKDCTVDSMWYTNLDHAFIKSGTQTNSSYYHSYYEKYDNYDAINVDRVCDIPNDYYDLMGVPHTFIGKISDRQFDIIDNPYPLYLNKEKTKRRFIVRRKKLTDEVFQINADIIKGISKSTAERAGKTFKGSYTHGIFLLKYNRRDFTVTLSSYGEMLGTFIHKDGVWILKIAEGSTWCQSKVDQVKKLIKHLEENFSNE